MSKLKARVLALLTCAVVMFSISAQAASAQTLFDDVGEESLFQVDEDSPGEQPGDDVSGTNSENEVSSDGVQKYEADSLGISIADSTITVLGGEFRYTGEEIKPMVEVTLDNEPLEAENYTVSYSENTAPGTAKIIVSGIGDYSGEKEASFTILKGIRTETPDAPVLFSKSQDCITIRTQEGIEYWMEGWGHWVQHEYGGTSPFDNLASINRPNNEYIIYARYAENEFYMESERSEALVVVLDVPEPQNNQIPQPTMVIFDGLRLSFRQLKPEDAPEDWDCRYRLQIIKDEEILGEYYNERLGEVRDFCIIDEIAESGRYEFRIIAEDFYNEYEQSEPLVCTYNYTRPSASMSPPTGLGWYVEGDVVYRTIEGDSNEGKEYGFWPYEYRLCYDNGLPHEGNGFLTERTQAPLGYVQADRTYYFVVRVLSGDLTKWTHSAWSVMSEPFCLNDYTADIGTSLRDLYEKFSFGELSAAEVLAALKALDQDELKLALHGDDSLRTLLGAIEDLYNEELRITSSTNVSSFIEDKLDGEIRVVGASFSSAGGDVTLNFENKKEDVEIESRYTNYVQFSIELEGATDDSELEVPIRITMPIPKPLSSNRLVIMHYTRAGIYEAVPFFDNGNGTISFTITHLSEFVFAEEPDGTDFIEFSDRNFKVALLQNNDLDTNEDGEISYDEALAAEYLWLSWFDIHDFSDLRYFENVRVLDCSENSMVSLDVTSLSKLETLYCNNNFFLQSLNVEGLTALTHISAYESKLTSLDVRSCTALEILTVYDNQLTELFISGLQSLDNFDARNNNLTTIDLTDLPSLYDIEISSNEISTLDVSALPHLKALNCNNNNFTSLDVNGLTELVQLSCEENRISSLTLTNLPNLQYLYVSGNQLPEIDVRELLNLKAVICDRNLLTSIDVNGLDQLARLSVVYNYIADESAVAGYSNPPTTTFNFDPQNIGRPSAPVSLQLSRDAKEILASWQKPASDGGSQIIRYEVSLKYNEMEEPIWEDIGLSMSHTFGKILPDQSSIVSVRAVNDNGPGPHTELNIGMFMQGIAEANVTISGTYIYNGNEIIPPPENVSVVLNGDTLEYMEHYQLFLQSGGTSAGEAFLRVLGVGPYTGIQRVPYTIEKAPQTTPAAPIVESISPNSVTFEAIPGAEYRQGTTGAWQDSPTFTGLTPGQSYSFYARMKETENYKASDISPARQVNTETVQLTGSVSITGDAKFGGMLTANTGSLATIPADQLGALSYQWKRGGTNIPGATNSTYTLVAADVGETITVAVTAADCEGEITSGATAIVDKADSPMAPDAPTMASRTDNSITLNTIAGAEYRRGASGVWQDSPTFSGLPANTGYTFYARIKETATRYGSAVSAESATITTLKAPQTAPAAPTLSSKGADTVTLNTITGAEYRQGTTGTWQDSPTFAGLTPNTSYTFYARMKETTSHEASPASDGLSVTTDRSALGGSVAIDGTAKFGEELTANTTALTSAPAGSLGALSYQWKRGSTNIAGATSATYTLVQADIGQVITVEVSAANCTGTVTSPATAAVDKADAPAAPAAPTMASRTEGSITLNTIAGAEYRSGASGSWQDSPTFTGLTGNTGYTFYTRIKETATYHESPVSAESATIFTLKAAQTAPAAPTLASKTADSVTLNSIAGAEYRRGTGAWQDSTSFSGLAPNTEYSFYARLKETSTHEASLASDVLTVTTDKSVLGGTVSVDGTPKFGEELAANTSALISTPAGSLGNLSYQWKRGGVNISGAIQSTYTLQQADVGSAISVTVSAANATGEVSSLETAVVTKADGPVAPAVAGAYTGDGETFTYRVNEIPGAEYSKDGIIWQDSNAFNGYTVGDSETFYARLKETATHLAGDVGDTGPVTFALLADRAAPPLAYTLEDGRTTITITPVDGAEYKFGDDAWGDTNTKTGYAGTEIVTIQIRYMENATHVASGANTAVVNLNKQNQDAPPAFELSFSYDKAAGAYMVTIPKVNGGEYSFDGTTFNEVNTTTAAPGAFVTGYVRLKETDDRNASPATASSAMLPYPASSIAVSAVCGKNEIIGKGGTLQLQAIVTPAEASQAVTWSVSKGSEFATVSSTGLLTAKADGTVTVRATANDGSEVFGELAVNITGQGVVKPSDPIEMSGVPANNQIRVGESFTLTPQGVNDTYTGSTGWTWDEEYFSATFNSPATFTALKAGTSTITFTAADGRVWSLTFTIQAAADSSTSSTSTDAIAATGDNANILLWMILAAVSLGAVTVLVVRRWQKTKARK